MTRWMGATVAGLVLFTVALGGCARAENRMQATIGKPAIVTATTATANLTGAAEMGGRKVLLSITAFTPPPDKNPVEIVVNATRADGRASQEIGRFAITPYAAFTAADPARVQNFTLTLPAALASERNLTLSVALSPVRGGGQGASLEVGRAVIQ